MKKLLLSLTATILSVCNVHAQAPVKRYDASYSTGSTYTPLTNATDWGYNTQWNADFSSNIPLPINFKYQNVPVTTIATESWGSLILNNKPYADVAMGHIAGINMAYADGGRGSVFYTTTGTTGNRIFKVEYKNMSRLADQTGKDTLNFQIWLYEQDNAIEYRAGYCNVPNTAFSNSLNGVLNGKDGIICGLIGNAGDSLSTNLGTSFLHVTDLNKIFGLFTDTALVAGGLQNPDSAYASAFLFGSFPPNGSIIRFVPVNPNSITAVDFDMAGIYPNPSADGMFTMNMKDVLEAGASLTIYDMTGKEIVKQPVSAQSSTIDLSASANGYYFGKIINGERTGIFKLIKE